MNTTQFFLGCFRGNDDLLLSRKWFQSFSRYSEVMAFKTFCTVWNFWSFLFSTVHNFLMAGSIFLHQKKEKMSFQKFYILVTNFLLIHQETNELWVFEWTDYMTWKSNDETIKRKNFIQSEITSKPIEMARCGLCRWLANLKSFIFVTNFFSIRWFLHEI